MNQGTKYDDFIVAQDPSINLSENLKITYMYSKAQPNF